MASWVFFPLSPRCDIRMTVSTGVKNTPCRYRGRRWGTLFPPLGFRALDGDRLEVVNVVLISILQPLIVHRVYTILATCSIGMGPPRGKLWNHSPAIPVCLQLSRDLNARMLQRTGRAETSPPITSLNSVACVDSRTFLHESATCCLSFL